MFCKHCGSKIPDNSRFCLNCGKESAPLKTEQPQARINEGVYKAIQNNSPRTKTTTKLDIGRVFIGLSIGLIVIGIYILAANILEDFKTFAFGFVGVSGLALVITGWVRERVNKGTGFLNTFMANFGFILLHLTAIIGFTLFDFYDFATFSVIFFVIGDASRAYAKESNAPFFVSNALIISYVVSFLFAITYQVFTNSEALSLDMIPIVLSVSLFLLLSRTHTIVAVATSFIPFIYNIIISINIAMREYNHGGMFISQEDRVVEAPDVFLIATAIFCVVDILLYFSLLLYRVKADYSLQTSALNTPRFKSFNNGSFMYILPYLIACAFLLPILGIVYDVLDAAFAQFESFNNVFIGTESLCSLIVVLIYLGMIFAAIKISDFICLKADNIKPKEANAVILFITLGFTAITGMVIDGYVSTILMVASIVGMFFIYENHKDNKILVVLNMVFIGLITFLTMPYAATSESDVIRVLLLIACVIFGARINKVLFVNIIPPCLLSFSFLIEKISIFDNFKPLDLILVVLSVLFILMYIRYVLKKENLTQEPLSLKISRNVWCVVLYLFTSTAGLGSIYWFLFERTSVVNVNNLILLLLAALALLSVCVLGLVNLKSALVPGVTYQFEVLSVIKFLLMPLASVIYVMSTLDQCIDLEIVDQISGFIITATFFVLGAIITYLGYKNFKNSFYITGTIAILCGVIKLSVYDVQSLNPTIRAITFLAGGIICLIAGVVLSKNKPKPMPVSQTASVSGEASVVASTPVSETVTPNENTEQTCAVEQVSVNQVNVEQVNIDQSDKN